MPMKCGRLAECWLGCPLRSPQKNGSSSRFLYARLYNLPELKPVRIEAERIVANLAAAYRADPSLLPSTWQHGGDEVHQLRTIGDFVAGMTDRFAIARHEELVGPVNLPANRF